MKKLIVYVFCFSLLTFLSLTPFQVKADCACICKDGSKNPVSDSSACTVYCSDKGGVTSCKTGSSDSAQVSLSNPLSSTPTPQQLIGKVIQAVLGLVGSLALLMFVYGGLTWMTAAGNGDKVQKGKDILVWSVIGLVVIFSSYVLVKFVFTSLGV